MRPVEGRNAPYLLFMLVLSVFSLIVLGISVALPPESDTRQILDYADDALCVLFFGDFLLSLRRAPNKWHYFVRWGWIDLLSCIPTVDYFRAGRVARIFRVFRVLRAIRSARIIATLILDRRAQGAMLAATLIAVLIIVLSSIGILQFEDVPNANILTAEDALWWTMETITTVGYGDRFPVTSEGRLLAAGLMAAGVGLIGIYTGYVASWFLRPTTPSSGDEVDTHALALQLVALDPAALAALADHVEQLRAVVNAAVQPRERLS